MASSSISLFAYCSSFLANCDPASKRLLNITAMILKDTSVHHHPEPRPTGFLSCSSMHNAFLHPDSLGADLDRFFHDGQDGFRASENIDDVDVGRRRDLGELRVARLVENAGILWIDRNDTITVRLHVTRDNVAWSGRISR